MAFKFKLDKLLDLDGLVRANNTTSLSDNSFNDRSLKEMM